MIFLQHSSVFSLIYIMTRYIKKVKEMKMLLKCKPLLQKCIWSCRDHDLWPMTLQTLSAIDTHMMITCVKSHWNIPT